MTTREAFEKWAIEAGYSVERIAYDPDNFLSGQYKSILTNTRWAAWQAATAAAITADGGDLKEFVESLVALRERAATNAALERAAGVRMKLPPAKYGENASTPQQIYQDAFDRGWQAGISSMRGAIRALKDEE